MLWPICLPGSIAHCPSPVLQSLGPQGSSATRDACISNHPHLSLCTCCSLCLALSSPVLLLPSPLLSVSYILLPFSPRIHISLEKMVPLFGLRNKQRNKHCWLPFSLSPKDIIWLNSQTIMKTGRYLSFGVISLRVKELEQRTGIWLNAPLC